MEETLSQITPTATYMGFIAASACYLISNWAIREEQKTRPPVKMDQIKPWLFTLAGASIGTIGGIMMNLP